MPPANPESVFDSDIHPSCPTNSWELGLSFTTSVPLSIASCRAHTPISTQLSTPTTPLPLTYPRRTKIMAATVIPGNELVRFPPSNLATAAPLTSAPLTSAHIESFFEQGFVIVPSLVPPALLQRLQQAIPKIEAAKLGRSNPLYDNLSFQVWPVDEAFRELALSSPVAAAAAQLTPTTPQSRGLIALKDAYFRLQGENAGCGFHVDDPFFWPCPPDAPGPGVNAWVALHDVGEDGGGLTIAPRSHLPGFVDHRKAIKDQTCGMAELDPAKNQQLEDIALSPHMKAGDVIFHTRWLFHRGNPFRPGSEAARGFGIARYSVRYMPAEAIVNEITFADGKVDRKPPIALNDANPSDFPSVEL